MDVQSSGLLHASGEGSSPSWHDIIPRAVPNLRHRLEALAKANIIRISLDDLLSLCKDGSYPVLTVTSRYGRRRYPVTALFIDGSVEPHEWATTLLCQMWEQSGETMSGFEQTLKDLNAGRDLAKKLWDVYCSPRVDNRVRLSSLLARRKYAILKIEPLSEDEEHEFSELARRRPKAKAKGRDGGKSPQKESCANGRSNTPTE